eukprot:m.88234 g.88234  ORF g.88234 m.88234 type:complete len:119 (-) comp9743_c0_seq3:953-1309(-)
MCFSLFIKICSHAVMSLGPRCSGSRICFNGISGTRHRYSCRVPYSVGSNPQQTAGVTLLTPSVVSKPKETPIRNYHAANLAPTTGCRPGGGQHAIVTATTAPDARPDQEHASNSIKFS